MLCPKCRRQVQRRATYCTVCGTSLNGAPGVFDLVLGDRSRIPVVADLTLGRASGNAVQLVDLSVSRHHARITTGGNGAVPLLEDRGSSHGTWLDGGEVHGAQALHDGSRIRLGDQELRVERRRDDSEPGRTLVVPPGASLVLPAAGNASVETAATRFGPRPRLRSGYALKRLAAGEGTYRWALKRLENGQFVQFSDGNAELLDLLDGRRSLRELVTEAERRFGAAGIARLAALLTTLSDGGYLADDEVADEPTESAPEPRRLVRPHEKAWPGAGRFFERTYERGAWLLFTRPVLVLLAALGVLGVAAFAVLVVRQYGTPFVVAQKIGWGGLVFLLGRSLVVAVHETAHGLTMTSFGRTPGRAGIKVLLVFPYAFVDTSDMWFEPSRRRIAVSAAGPTSDFTLGGMFSLCCLAMPAGTTRDIVFQLAFASYVGCIFNLSPLLDRDGYFILVDAFREPGLRNRARQYLRARLSGRGATPSKALARYSYISIGWSLFTAAFVGAMSLRYEGALSTLLPHPLAYVVLGILWVVVLLPVLSMVVPPLVDRVRGGNA
jgi:pSer/pThr/pTyr-binding forkhead associated (FHA) protein